MLSSKNIVTFGLTESQNRIIEDHLKSLECSLTALKDYRDLTDTRSFLSLINAEALDEEAVREIIAYYTEVDGGLTEMVILASHGDALSRASHAQVFPDFFNLEAALDPVLQKAHARAKKEENTIHNISHVLAILREIRNHPGITTMQLSERIDRNSAAVRRYIEALRVMGEDIVYDGKSKSWRLRNGESSLMKDFEKEPVRRE